MAPEVLIKGSHYTSKVDVYAFGVVLWELFTSEVPYSGLDPAQIIIKVIYEDLRPAMPTSLNPQMKDLIMQCWDRNPDVRPTFDEIVRKFVEEKLMFDGANYNVVLEHIKRSQTREELVMNELEILFKQLDDHKVGLDKIIEKVNKNNGLPHSMVDVAWNSLEKYKFSENERKDYAKLLVISFLKTSKAEKITEILCNFPPNSVDEETMTKIIVEVPTGSPKTDRNIVIAACKNGCADLCSLYAMNIQDIILSLEVCAMTKVDKQLNVIIGDKCVQCLSNSDINLVAAAVKCLISTDNSQRITTNSIEKLIESENFEKIGISALISQGKKSMKVQEKLLSVVCANAIDKSDYSLALVSLCNNLENAKYILKNCPQNNEIFCKSTTCLLCL
ncbi:hypothetical protein TVAG_200580 [Trichomonas vaginalis G3]|uniref:Protein kinase domain-containing protein n=1 Tax=Trichomonas vaginalis (strain ATCC PRA-98 / G3) TaxID=412133 RepID=A2FRZ4_TRIV3|nr:hypothetical protein TVAG_200580 [Trichomonas vaginalis G3]|eukprot:XP_001305252.1 hypothetical protein [Trichomonas vaginalis G3]